MKLKQISIGEIVDREEASIQTGPFGTQLKASHYTEEGWPVINVRNVGYGDLRPEKLEFINEETRDRLSVHVLEEQDIVFGRKGAVDRHLFVKSGQSGWLQGSDCIRLRFSSPRIEPRFVSYAFLTQSHQSWMLTQSGNKATMASLNQDIIKRIEIPDLPRVVQTRIADILSAYDDLIENNKRRMQLLEEAARQLYREWFVRLRFPGHEHTQITNGLPEGWERKPVGDVLLKFRRKKKIPKDQYLVEGDIPCIDQSTDFIGGYTNDAEAEHRELLPIIVFGDHTRVLKFIDFPFASGADGTQLLYPSESTISPEYLYLALCFVDLSNYFYARHFKFLKEQKILAPEPRVVSRFTDEVSLLFQQIGLLRNQNQKLRVARDLLLPKLMNGEIAV